MKYILRKLKVSDWAVNITIKCRPVFDRLTELRQNDWQLLSLLKGTRITSQSCLLSASAQNVRLQDENKRLDVDSISQRSTTASLRSSERPTRCWCVFSVRQSSRSRYDWLAHKCTLNSTCTIITTQNNNDYKYSSKMKVKTWQNTSRSESYVASTKSSYIRCLTLLVLPSIDTIWYVDKIILILHFV